MNCGKQIDEDSVFCQFCGTRSLNTKTTSKKRATTAKAKGLNKQTKITTEVSLWDKFAEVYDAKDEDRKRFNNLSSLYIWEVLDRLAVNAFESFIQSNKEELNKQPYKTIESLKTTYTWSVIGGYKLWLAEALLDNKEELNKFKSFSLDKIIDKWKEYDFDKALKTVSEDMGNCITRYLNFRLSSFLEAIPEAKELQNATVENLKTSLMFQILNGYYAGKIENTFRK